ncbi:MAG: hypothetical protein ABIS92_16360 [Polyangia bacterium]
MNASISLLGVGIAGGPPAAAVPVAMEGAALPGAGAELGEPLAGGAMPAGLVTTGAWCAPMAGAGAGAAPGLFIGGAVVGVCAKAAVERAKAERRAVGKATRILVMGPPEGLGWDYLDGGT